MSKNAVQHCIILISVIIVVKFFRVLFYNISQCILGKTRDNASFPQAYTNHAPIKNAHTKTRPSIVTPPVLSCCQCNGHGCGPVHVLSRSVFSRKAVFRNNKSCYQWLGFVYNVRFYSRHLIKNVKENKWSLRWEMC